MTAATQFWSRHFLGMEAIVSIIPAVTLAAWFILGDGVSYVDEFMDGNRTNIYRTTAGIAGTLLGFSIAVVSVVLNAFSTDRLRTVRESKYYPNIWKTFFQATWFLGGLTVTALVCVI